MSQNRPRLRSINTPAASGAVSSVLNVAQLQAPVQFAAPNVAENLVMSYMVPGGSLGSTGHLTMRLGGFLQANAVAAGTVTLRAYYGAATLVAAVVDMTALNIATYPYAIQLDFGNTLNSLAVQSGIFVAQFQQGTTLAVTAGYWGAINIVTAVDSTAAQLFRFTAQFDVGVDGVWNTSYGSIQTARAA